MALRIEYARSALKQLEAIADDLQVRFGSRVASQQLTHIEAQLYLLAEHPHLGPPLHRHSTATRYRVAHPRLIIYYRVEAGHIHILHLHDTRLPPPEDV